MRGWPDPLATLRAAAPSRLVVDADILAEEGVASAVRDNLLAAVERYRGLGSEVDIRPVPTVSRVRHLIETDGWLAAADIARTLAPMLVHPRNATIDPRIRARLEAAGGISDETITRLRRARGEFMQAIGADLAGAVLVMPTVAHTAPLLGPLDADPQLFARVNMATLILTMVGSFLDMPTLAIPTGHDADGLATSLQLSLPRGEDDRLLAASLALEAASRRMQ